MSQRIVDELNPQIFLTRNEVEKLLDFEEEKDVVDHNISLNKYNDPLLQGNTISLITNRLSSFSMLNKCTSFFVRRFVLARNPCFTDLFCSGPQVFLRPQLQIMLLYSTLLCKKIAPAPGGVKDISPLSSGGGQNRSFLQVVTDFAYV